MIERYAKKPGHRLFRAEDGEYLMLVDSAVGPFRAYLRTRRPGVVKFRARPFVELPHAERIRLPELVIALTTGING